MSWVLPSLTGLIAVLGIIFGLTKKPWVAGLLILLTLGSVAANISKAGDDTRAKNEAEESARTERQANQAERQRAEAARKNADEANARATAAHQAADEARQETAKAHREAKESLERAQAALVQVEQKLDAERTKTELAAREATAARAQAEAAKVEASVAKTEAASARAEANKARRDLQENKDKISDQLVDMRTDVLDAIAGKKVDSRRRYVREVPQPVDREAEAVQHDATISVGVTKAGSVQPKPEQLPPTAKPSR